MDGQVLEKLYELYSREIYLYLYSLCRDPDTAEDLTQETFLRALLTLPKGHENMRAWLYRVARNLFFDLRRRKPELSLEESGELPAGEDEALERLVRDEQRRLLLRLIGTLERKKREVLVLQYYSGLGQKEIAALLGLSHENVRVLSLRARRELRKKLEENGYDFS